MTTDHAKQIADLTDEIKQIEDELQQERSDLDTLGADDKQRILRKTAGREGVLATKRRELARLTGQAPEAVRDHIIQVRFTARECEELTVVAGYENCTVSQYIRTAIATRIATTCWPEEDSEHFDR